MFWPPKNVASIDSFRVQLELRNGRTVTRTLTVANVWREEAGVVRTLFVLEHQRIHLIFDSQLLFLKRDFLQLFFVARIGES